MRCVHFDPGDSHQVDVDNPTAVVVATYASYKLLPPDPSPLRRAAARYWSKPGAMSIS